MAKNNQWGKCYLLAGCIIDFNPGCEHPPHPPARNTRDEAVARGDIVPISKTSFGRVIRDILCNSVSEAVEIVRGRPASPSSDEIYDHTGTPLSRQKRSGRPGFRMSAEEAAGKTFISRDGKIRILICGGHHRGFPPEVLDAIKHLVTLIKQQAAHSGMERFDEYPERIIPDGTDLHEMLLHLWDSQHGNCGLCYNKLNPGAQNDLLKIAPARVDMTNKAFTLANTVIAHRACRDAKHTGTLNEWLEYLGILDDPPPKALPADSAAAARSIRMRGG
jgi:hypothetical protein